MTEAETVPAIGAEETLRQLAAERASRRTKLRLGLVGLAAILPCLATAPLRPSPLIVWNVSASAPRGLYLRLPAGPIRRGDVVIARLPVEFRKLAAERHYLPDGVPLIKTVRALPGDKVCGSGSNFRINGREAGVVRRMDAAGRALPRWPGCRRLSASEVLLLSGHPWSFDGRYFGPSKRTDIVSRARLIWAN